MPVSTLLHRIQRRGHNALSDFRLRHDLTGLKGINLRFLFTCRKGVYLFDRGRVRPLVPGPHFGITAESADTLVVAEWVGNRDIQKTVAVRYRFDGQRMQRIGPLAFRDAGGEALQPFGIHQLRAINGFLWVTNTRENVVWQCTFDGEVLREWSEEGKMPFVESDFEAGNAYRKATDTYRHYNSIAFHDGHYYVVAHNCTQHDDHPGKRSYIVMLDEELNTVRRIPDVGRACHDVLFVEGRMYVCSSLEGTVMEDGQPILDLGVFLRGLGQIGSIMIVGGSPYQIERSARDASRSTLFIVDLPARRVLFTLELGRLGNVLDILCLDS